jgi:hypothetical protein
MLDGQRRRDAIQIHSSRKALRIDEAAARLKLYGPKC